MICKLPLLSRYVLEDQDYLNISLSFDRIHWCMPYMLKIIQSEHQWSFLAILSYLLFALVLGISLKMIIFDTKVNHKKSRNRRPPKKNHNSANREIEDDVNQVPYRRIINDSFL